MLSDGSVWLKFEGLRKIEGENYNAVQCSNNKTKRRENPIQREGVEEEASQHTSGWLVQYSVVTFHTCNLFEY